VKPQVSPLMARQHAHVDALHRHIARSIHATWRDAWRAMTPALQRFMDAYAAELARVRRSSAADDETSGDDDDSANERVSLLWLHTSGALRSLRPAVLSSAQYAATRSQLATQQGQQQGVTDGQIAAGLLIAAMLEGGGASGGGARGSAVIRPPAPLGVVGYSGFNNAPLSTYFDALAPNAWADVEKAAHAGVSTGATPTALFASLVAAALTHPTQRALLLGEQETTNAYRAGVDATFTANAAVVGGWMWVAQDDACDECAAMNGTIHDVSESLDSHPRCRCQQQPLGTPVNLV
jgi:hypothetical protein